MAVKDALLALLADGPSHGYNLKSRFDEATGLAWPLNVGQVYTTLQRLERDELVRADGEPDDDGRQRYLLTALGREALTDWIDTPFGSPVSSRDEVSMKVMIALATGVAPALDIVKTQRISAMEALQSLTAMKPQGPKRGLAWQLHLDRSILLAESEVRWLDLVEQRLETSETNATNGTGARPAKNKPAKNKPAKSKPAKSRPASKSGRAKRSRQ